MRERVARHRFEILKLVPQLLAGESLERRVGHDRPDAAIDGDQARRARRRARCRERRAATAGAADCTRQKT